MIRRASLLLPDGARRSRSKRPISRFASGGLGRRAPPNGDVRRDRVLGAIAQNEGEQLLGGDGEKIRAGGLQ